ncbi:DUF6343 family protein, partial [Streptomyces sp. NPDC001226]
MVPGELHQPTAADPASLWGLVWATFGTVAFALVGRPGWAAACG